MPTRLKFSYNNHRGELHVYVVRPARIEFDNAGMHPGRWVLHAIVCEQDGEPISKVRSFKLAELMDVEEIES